MKPWNCILVSLAPLLISGSVAQATVESSAHDFSGAGSKLCDPCHVPHNALGAALWSSSTSDQYGGVADLCHSCHDGSVTDIGVHTVFNQTKEQHVMVGQDCSGAGGCHDAHNQNPNGTGRFLVKEVTRTNNSFCETCHDQTPFEGAEHLGVHDTENSHYTDGVTFICESCHAVHGAVPQTINPPGLTNPILLADNRPGEFDGEFCVSCHAGIPPPEVMAGVGGVASSDVYDYVETIDDGTQSKHTTHSNSGEFTVSGCEMCHVPMCRDAPALNRYDLREDNTNSNYCVSCHNSAEAPQLKGNSHFSQAAPEDPSMNQGLTLALPWSNELDEDGAPGQDWLSATTNMMTCETCHSVHRRGYRGADAGYLLRYPNDDLNTLCQACHTSH